MKHKAQNDEIRHGLKLNKKVLLWTIRNVIGE